MNPASTAGLNSTDDEKGAYHHQGHPPHSGRSRGGRRRPRRKPLYTISAEMKLTKEDFMRLPKERLAELLVEAQDQVRIETIQVPVSPIIETRPWWEQPFGPTVTYNDNRLTAKN